MKTDWENFSKQELTCSCCGDFNPSLEFQDLMDELQEIRTELGFSFPITSAYRCVNHPIEKAKIDKGGTAGEHNRAALDIAVVGFKAWRLIQAATARGFSVGISQSGPYNSRFIHLDKRPNPTVWSY